MNGPPSSGPAWAHGLKTFPAPNNDKLEIYETPSLNARYLLDTDTVSFAIRGHGRVAANLLQHRPAEIFISSITLAELRFGAERKRSRRLHRLIDAFVDEVTVLPFDQLAADRFAPVAAARAQRGEPIGTFDTQIAAHALSLGLTLVTNNLARHSRNRNSEYLAQSTQRNR